MRTTDHAVAIEAARGGEWHHAILHQIEGDIGNGRYGYARSSGRRHDDFTDSQAEWH